MLVTVPARAVNVPLVAPLAIVTDAGIDTAALLLESATAVALVAALESVTVQVEDAPEIIEAGEHCTDDRDEPREIVPPEPVMLAFVPSAEAPNTFVIGNVSRDPVIDDESVAVTTAATPLPIAFAFEPLARQVSVPVPRTHVSVLAALVSAGPAVAPIETKSLAG